MTMSMAIAAGGKGYHGGLARKLQVKGRARQAMSDIMVANGEPALASPRRFRREYLAKSQPRFRIGDGQGRYLLHDGLGITDDRYQAWFGSADQAQCALAEFPHAEGMRALPVLKLPDVLPRML